MNKDQKRFIQLSWLILEHKYYYYESIKGGIISDPAYDLLEDEYKLLATKLNKTTSAINMVGFDKTRASCRLVMEKLVKKRKK